MVQNHLNKKKKKTFVIPNGYNEPQKLQIKQVQLCGPNKWIYCCLFQFIVVSALVCVAVASPQFQQQQQYYQQQPLLQQQQALQPPIPILKSNSDVKPDGSYQFDYETGNGIQAAENGYVKNAGIPGAEINVVQGYYQYVGPEGIPIQVTYIADENGFRASVSVFVFTFAKNIENILDFNIRFSLLL